MFDSHCHLHDPRIGAEAAAMIARARAAGVRGFLLAGVGPEGWPVEEALARAHPELAVAYGVHPQLVAEVDDAESERLIAALAATLSDGTRVRAVALGEIGLDGYGERRATLERQERAFRAQLALARAHDLPVVLHVLQAHARALEILRGDGLPKAGGVAHSYSGSSELVRDYCALGLHISFAGTVTYPNAPKIQAAARAVPKDRLLVETDAPFQTPYLAPGGARPAQNEPAFLVAIVEALAQIRGEPVAGLAAYTEANARQLFKI
jgi:TatD DNase family protein